MLDEKLKERYSRQIISKSIGEKGQEKLLKTKVLQIGAGGLGSPCALYLVAAGIGELIIIDNDIVSLSNLQRQILFSEEDIGQSKVQIAKKKLSALNSNVKINAIKDYANEYILRKYVSDVDFIVDCSDNMKTKFLINHTAIQNNKFCIIAGIKDFYGQIITVNPKVSACYQCVYSNPGLEESDIAPLPVMGATPGILGTLEALEVIKTALGLPNLENTLLMVNLLDMTFNKIDVVKDNNTCICSH
ncbi:MAG: Sulfur carrier protein ThiS adenylyltransferase [Promethearchaeota archaeon]|nr:MAG: Sulfur carrier protein ThiS adenylyltransferase [Candidatus Lokiarchaeota archaeon]